MTTDGKTYIKRYMAGYVPAIAQAIALGVGSASESASDTSLQFEIERVPVDITSYDFVNNKLIFKGSLDDSIGGVVYEVGIFSTVDNLVAGQYGSRLVATFDSASEDWVDNVSGASETNYSSTAFRTGPDGLRHQPSASGTKISALREIELDFSGNSAADIFKFAFNVANANTSTVRFQFLTNTTNYYEFNLGAQTAGYKIVNRTKSSATVTGTPTWASITEIRVFTTSTSGGASDVTLDGIRVEDVDTINDDYVMVSRKVLASPFTLVESMSQDIEFALDFNVP